MTTMRKGEPFARVKLDALALIRAELPERRWDGARDAVLALCESAARRRDFGHERGDTLQDLVGFAANGEKRLKDHLRELAALGMVEILPQTDGVGRDLASLYKLTPAGAVSLTGRVVGVTAKGVNQEALLTHPTRAGDTSEGKREERKSPPSPPKGGRKRDWLSYRQERDLWIAEVAPHPDTEPEFWPAVRADLRSRVGVSTFDLNFETLHPHRLHDGVLYLGVHPDRAGFAGSDRFKRVLDAALRLNGDPFEIVACSASQTAPDAPAEPQLGLADGRLRRVS